MRPLGRNDRYSLPTPATDFALKRWQTDKERQAQDKLRLPVVFAASRIGLADRRCSDLSEHLHQARDRLLNLSGHESPADFFRLEDRVLKLEDALYAERLLLFRDLIPLMHSARDASVEAIRASWLNEFSRLLGGEHHDSDSAGEGD